MKNYLLYYNSDVADEGNIVMIKIFTESEKNEIIKSKTTLTACFGSMESDEKVKIEEEDFTEISEDEVKMLKRLRIDDINTGIQFNEDDEDEVKICPDCHFYDDRFNDNIYPCDECDGQMFFTQKKIPFKKRTCPNCNKNFDGGRLFCNTECLISIKIKGVIMSINIEKLKKRLERLKKQKSELSIKHIGNEQNLTYHGGYDMGYLDGKIYEVENLIDSLED